MAFLLAKAGAPSLAFLLAPQVSNHQILKTISLRN
jgi:hypothetical protein